ncbi:hypothetical protein VC83_07467 [Pseudogymnoascus destructans]|uniref:SprT-like domain-containing protein n=2 Tax=Pseudogymnoascus destructans TaxID=655981 RepID=L8G1E3_PSED2|nr:uncharacterized protein VC83_07467 [Pseudogymnoascus destructans]ELR06528.1 hypothetical protein GMDG_02163 [Pseudogymnoascus destructans 20631-21]OAF56093.1 hypothetical protein VC83_07467 [Pseudogymnoascus destructans]
MYRNGRWAVDAVPRDGFQPHPRPVDYHGRERRYTTPYHRQCTRFDSVTTDNRLKRKNTKRRPHAAYSVEGSNSNVACPRLQNPASSLGPDAGWLTDEEASRGVDACFKKRQNHVQGRILRKLLNRELAFDQESLDRIRFAADYVLFDGMLRGKVKWRWSKEGEEGYENELLGSTTPQYSPETGIEAWVVLSRPLLLSGRYSQDLLLSTFLHEMVHCYLFICCGDRAQKDGGHTPGFQQIVQLINGWTGNSRLRLCSMKADLDHFTVGSEDLSCCPVAEDIAYEPSSTSQYVDFGDCTFVCGSGQHTLSGNGHPLPGFEEIHRNVSLPPLAYVSMQERMMQALGGSVTMPIC